jgi:hypothetical protein
MKMNSIMTFNNKKAKLRKSGMMLLLIGLLTFTTTVFATVIPTYAKTAVLITTTWNGTAWSNGAPTLTTDAVIAGNYTSTAALEANTLTVNTNAVVVIASGHTVTLNGALTVVSGSFTLNSNASLIQLQPNVVNTGNIIVKRISSPLMRLDYTLWSSPVANQNLQAFSPATVSNRFNIYNPVTNAFEPLANPELTVFNSGVGYLIRVPNTHPVTTPTTWSGAFTGVPNNGTFTVPVTTNTYNAVGNPYPSPIDADQFITANGITEALYFWRKTNNGVNGSYATYTLAGGVGCDLNDLSNPLRYTPNGTIQVGQGFVTKATTTSFTFTNAMRVADTRGQFLRVNENRSRIWLNLTNTTGLYNQMMVAYMPNATAGVDLAMDGKFFNDNTTALNSLLNGEEYAIQAKGLPFVQTDVLPLAFKVQSAGSYTITLASFDGLFVPADQRVLLKDNWTNAVQDLKAGSYTFEASAGIYNSRFEIQYANTLATTQNVFMATDVVVIPQDQKLLIESGTVPMDSIAVYDINGKLLFTKNNINTTTTTIPLGVTHQVVLLKITSKDKQSVVKKVVL